MTNKCKKGAYTTDPDWCTTEKRSTEKKYTKRAPLFINTSKRKTGIEYVTNLLFTFVFISIGHQHDNETPSKQCPSKNYGVKWRKKDGNLNKPSASQSTMSVRKNCNTQTWLRSMYCMSVLKKIGEVLCCLGLTSDFFLWNSDPVPKKSLVHIFNVARAIFFSSMFWNNSCPFITAIMYVFCRSHNGYFFSWIFTLDICRNEISR